MARSSTLSSARRTPFYARGFGHLAHIRPQTGPHICTCTQPVQLHEQCATVTPDSRGSLCGRRLPPSSNRGRPQARVGPHAAFGTTTSPVRRPAVAPPATRRTGRAEGMPPATARAIGPTVRRWRRYPGGRRLPPGCDRGGPAARLGPHAKFGTTAATVRGEPVAPAVPARNSPGEPGERMVRRRPDPGGPATGRVDQANCVRRRAGGQESGAGDTAAAERRT